MLDDSAPSEQYTGLPFYSPSLASPYNSFDLAQMKRTQESIGGPEAVKKPRQQYSPGSSGAFDQSPSYYGNIGAQSSPALYSSASNNAMSNASNSPIGSIGMPSSASQSNGLQQYGNGTLQAPGSPNSVAAQQQMFFQQAQQQQQSQQQQQQQQLLNMGMMNGGMGMMGNGMNMFNNMAGMPMSMGFGFPQMTNAFAQSGLSMPGQAGFTPQVAAAAGGNPTGRTVYVGNLPADASVDELLNLVRFGPIESVRVLPEKSCVFISFLDGATAAAFHTDATIKKLTLHGQELKIGWGKASPVPSQVLLSITQSNASRNVYLGGLDENMTEEQLRDDLGRFGLIDQVKIVRDKNIGFVHFLSISTATKVVATLPTEPAWAGKRVNYGKDRCAYVPKSQQNAAQNQAQTANLLAQAQSASGITGAFPPFSPLASAGFGAMQGFDTPTNAGFANAMGQGLNRTVYIGNIHPETSTEDLCNTIRGGIVQSIRYMQDKHIAFITFVDPASAFTFHQVATYQGLTLNNRRLKIGWGKNSGPLSPALALSIHAGATRNVYVGNIEDFETFTVEKLKRDFGEYGDIELVNYLKEKNCAFVNFTNISNAIKAIEGIKNKPDYANLRIAHGKDRCANAPRAGPQGGNTMRLRTSGGPTSPLPMGMGGDGAVHDDLNGDEPMDAVDHGVVLGEA